MVGTLEMCYMFCGKSFDHASLVPPLTSCFVFLHYNPKRKELSVTSCLLTSSWNQDSEGAYFYTTSKSNTGTFQLFHVSFGFKHTLAHSLSKTSLLIRNAKFLKVPKFNFVTWECTARFSKFLARYLGKLWSALKKDRMSHSQ